jgi:hypothetical protein
LTCSARRRSKPTAPRTRFRSSGATSWSRTSRQHVTVGVQKPRYHEVLRALTPPAQWERIARAVEPILAHAAA